MTGRSRPLAGALAGAVGDALVIAVLVTLAALAFGGAYGGTRWLVAAAGGALVGAAAVLLVDRLRGPWWVAAAAATGGYLLFGAALAVPSTAIGGVLPSVESLRLLTVGVVASWRQLLTVAVPVGSSGALMIPAYLSALVATAVGAGIALRTRRPRWALAAPLAMLVVAALFGASTPWLPLVSGLGVAVGGMVWASWRSRAAGSGVGLDLRRPVSALVVMAAAVAAGYLLGPQVDVGPRSALRESVQPPFDPREYPSPLAGFRTYFKDARDEDLFTVTGMPAGARIRLAAMDDYNGVTYSISSTVDPYRKVGDDIEDGSADIPGGRRATVGVTVDGLRGAFLPVGGYLTALRFQSEDAGALHDGFRYSPGNGTGVVVGGLTAGDRYVADVVVPPAATDLDLTATPVAQVALPSPGKISDDLKSMAGQLTEQATTPYQKIVAIQRGLADQGFLSHGTQGEEVSASGHGLDRLTALVGDQVMVGDQEQFAPAMALMLRSQGIPARVVLGFAPPAPGAVATGPAAGSDGTSGEASWTVRGADATAWVEVPFAGAGWVAFDPTPDDQRIEQQPDPQPEVAPRAQVLQPPPPPQPPQEITADDVDQGDADHNDADSSNDAPEQDSRWLRTVLVVTAWVGIPLLIVGTPMALVLWLKARRRDRRRSAASVADRFSGGWDQILDVATDFGYQAPRGRTRTETAQDLDAALGGATVLLARRADARVFGPEELDDAEAQRFWADVDAAAVGLSTGRSRWRRWWAAVSPRSLAGRRRR